MEHEQEKPLKWTDGKSYYKTNRITRLNYLITINNTNINTNIPEENTNTYFETQIENAAHSSALNYDENTWELLNQSCATNDFKSVNKREEMDSKISDRDLVQQIGYNPFLGSSNYVNDISIRDEFLKPQNTKSV